MACGGGRLGTGPPNGLELSCRAARAKPPPLYGNSGGKTSLNFPHASRVSCSELLGGIVVQTGLMGYRWTGLMGNTLHQHNGAREDPADALERDNAHGRTCPVHSRLR